MEIFNRDYTREEIESLVGDLGQICGIQPLACADGLEKGTNVLKFWNASGLQLDVIPDRAMDLGRLFHKGIPLTWSSGTGYVHPAYLQDRGWPGGFHGGLLATCGLNNVGPACQDGGERHEQHGRISRLPASQVAFASEWVGNDLLLKAQGIMEDRVSTGYHMRLCRQVEVAGARNLIRLRDTVTNLGLDDSPCMLKYHMNFGFPLVEDYAELFVPNAEHRPGLRFSEVTADKEVQYIPCRSDETGDLGQAAIRNERLGVEVVVRYSSATLPHLWRWHDFRQGMRVFAIEPSNCRVKPRDQARASGALPTLKPGESIDYTVEIEINEI